MRAEAEQEAEARFAASRHLAVYGTLAPGEPNHAVVAPLGGTWRPGFVRGCYDATGWHDYPTFHPDPTATPYPVALLIGTRLPDAWPRLDAFEGPAYVRVLVPVLSGPVPSGEATVITVANLYAAHPSDHAERP